MEEAVNRVLREVGHHHDLDELQEEGLRGHRRLQTRAHRPPEEDGGGDEGQQHRELHEQVAHREMQEIGEPALAEEPLLGPPRPQDLERDEQERCRTSILCTITLFPWLVQLVTSAGAALAAR